MSSDLTEPATDKSAAFTHKPTESNFFRIKLENDPEETFKAKRDYSERYTKQTFNESIKKQIVIDDYKSEMVQNFSKFRSESLFTDIFIYVDGVEFPCHKVVLCAASLYFKAMFSCDLTESRHGKVFIENISPWTMKRLLDFIYTGKIEINYENVIEIFNAAMMFQLNKLADKCSDYIHDHIDLANCIEIHVFASMHQLEQLEIDTFQFILDNFMQLINFQSMFVNKTTGLLTNSTNDAEEYSPLTKNARIPGASGTSNNTVHFGDFVRLNELTFSNLIKSDSLNVSREIYVYYALKKWMDYRILVKDAPKATNLKKAFENLFKNIRLNALTQNELEHILQNDAHVNTNESLVEQIKYLLENYSQSPFGVIKKKLSFEIDNFKENESTTNKPCKSITNVQNFHHSSETSSLDLNISKLTIRPSTIPRDYLCHLKSNQFKYYDFYNSKWNCHTSWPPVFFHTNTPNEYKNLFSDSEATNNNDLELRYDLKGYSTCLIKNILYVFGGYFIESGISSQNKGHLNINDSETLKLIDKVWRFDPINNEWSNCKEMPRKRAFHISISLESSSHKKLGKNSSIKEPVNDLIFLLYGLSSNDSTNNSFSLSQCMSIDFYNLATDQWSSIKNTDSLLNHHIYQSINNQNRSILTESTSQTLEETTTDSENNLTILNQLIENQQTQSKLVISLKNLIYILKENCLHCYEFDLSLEQLICLPYFRLPANLSTFVLAGVVPFQSEPSSTKSLFTWYSDEEDAELPSPESSKDLLGCSELTEQKMNDESEVNNYKEVLIYLMNMEMGVIHKFFPAKNKLKKLPNLLMSHKPNETFIIKIKSKLYVTGGIQSSEDKVFDANSSQFTSENNAANAIEVFDEEDGTWSIFMGNIDSHVSPSTSVFSIEDNSDSHVTNQIFEQKHFFKLKMALV